MKHVVLLVVLALGAGGCARGMVRAGAIKPAVDILVPEYMALKAAEQPPDPIAVKKIALARELKATVDLAAKGGDR